MKGPEFTKESSWSNAIGGVREAGLGRERTLAAMRTLRGLGQFRGVFGTERAFQSCPIEVRALGLCALR